MNSVTLSFRDTIIRGQVLICLTSDGLLTGYKTYLTGGYFPSLTIYREDEGKISRKDANRLRRSALAYFPLDVFLD